ncbi:MAG: NUDIX domain-containing protein [Actinomycetaceae bacterium]|nr:NUDIX domain-containing protein [Arcanobacterium sp.]MDD7686406.1 NUDIX domain-containing protein [Actinomycetaceae bacterium]
MSDGCDVHAIERDAIEREWPPDAEGFPHRQAARTVLINPAGETYLIHGHDVDDPDFNWWFTVGGGIMAGESAREGAVRELREETGLVISPARLEGPVLYREATFHFVGNTRKQDEHFFVARLDTHEADAVTTGTGRELTALEENVLDQGRWFSLGQLTGLIEAGDHVFPQDLVHYLRGWLAGWDGSTIHVTER